MDNLVSHILRVVVLIFSLLLFISLTIGKGHPFPIPKPPSEVLRAEVRSASWKSGEGFKTVATDLPLTPSLPYRASLRQGTHDADAAAAPCCLMRGQRTDCFIRDANADLLHGVIIDNSATWTSLDFRVIGDVACLVLANGDVEVLAINRRRHLMTRTLTRQGWKNWMPTAAVYLNEAPSCVARTIRNVDCIFRGMDNSAYWIGSMDGVWSENVVPLGGDIMRPLSCLSPDENSIVCYSIGVDCRLHVFDWDVGKHRSRWTSVGRLVMRGKPAVTSHGDLSRDVFTIGRGNTLLWKEYDIGGNEREWKTIGHQIGFSPSCLGTDDGRMHCFFVQLDGILRSLSWNGDSWKSAASVAGNFLGTPSCHEIKDGHVVCHVLSSDASTMNTVIVDVRCRECNRR